MNDKMITEEIDRFLADPYFKNKIHPTQSTGPKQPLSLRLKIWMSLEHSDFSKISKVGHNV